MSAAERELDGRAAIVVGVDAIGEGIARRFERAGARVARIDGSAGIVDGSTREPCALDDATAVARAVDRAATALGGTYALVVNVLPRPALAPLDLQSDDDFATAFARVRATAAAMRAALPHLRAGGGGRILLVGHRYGEGANDALGAYNAAAWSLRGLARTAAVDWGQHQITTNVLVPFADTPEYRDYCAKKPALLDLLVSQVPIPRAGDPEDDIGGAALVLAGATGAFVNGEVLYADGGMHVAGPVLSPGKFRR